MATYAPRDAAPMQAAAVKNFAVVPVRAMGEAGVLATIERISADRVEQIARTPGDCTYFQGLRPLLLDRAHYVTAEYAKSEMLAQRYPNDAAQVAGTLRQA